MFPLQHHCDLPEEFGITFKYMCKQYAEKERQTDREIEAEAEAERVKQRNRDTEALRDGDRESL